ncbi:UDP-N-acetylglucosamine pyrophosphorylase [Trichomonascus vanleenenianus]|uniref:UDP-N-acetylglucosamine diphosphorylase n=1 Tax=Trichomonascus vanleenenianus TaxID=2268995 RepID=UPI003ECAEB2D
MTTSDITEIRERYEKAGQGHVFRFWDSLTEDEKTQLLTQLNLVDVEQVTTIAQETLEKAKRESSPGESTITPLPSTSTASLLDASPEEAEQWYDAGMRLIEQNKVGVVLLAGGQGTRLGSSAPKGCYDVGLPSRKSLFQLQAERIKKLSELAGGATIPWYIMTSGPTRKPTVKFFADNGYFGLDPANITFFEQGVLPCLTPEGKIILANKSTVAFAPDGNGGIYNALNRSGVLADIAKRGIEHIHTYCVDNSLVRIADPSFIGFSAQRGVDIATKVVRKRDATESVGLIVSKNDAPAVIEYSEISPELASATVEGNPGLLKLRAANIVNHYYSAKFLLNIPNWTSSYLPFHIASKKIPYIDLESGEVVAKPSKPNGIKLEQFVFDVFPRLSFDKFASLEVSRKDEFSPLKNGPGAKDDCPETSRRDLLAQSKRWLEKAGAIVEVDEVEVSPLTSYGGEGLGEFKGQKITSASL